VIPLLILSVWFIFWYSSFMIWGSTLSQIYQKVSSEGGGPSNLVGLTSQINYAQGYGYNVIEIFLKQYGGPVLVAVLSVIAFPILWKTIIREQKQETIFSLYGPWAVLCVIIPVLYIFNMPFGPLRFLAYTSVLGTLFIAGFMSYLVIRSREFKKRIFSYMISIVILVLLFTLFMSALLTLYPSPYSYIQNYQDTHSEISGMTNFFEYRDVSIPVIGITQVVQRFSVLLLTPEQQALQNLPWIQDRPPYHFSYDQNRSMSSSFEKETDMIIVKRDKVYYTDYFPSMAKIRFTPEDFERVNNDPGVNLVYSNGEFDLQAIKPKGYGVIV